MSAPVDWARVDTALLDMDGTLLDLRYDNAFWFDALPARLAARDGVSVQAARARVEHHARALLGTLEFYCLDHWSALLDLDVASANEELAGLIAVRPAVVDFLTWLRARGIRTVLATNSHPRGMDFKLARTGLGAYLDATVSSHDLGHPKEDPAFWAALAARGVGLERAVLVDDNHAVLACAQRSGVGQVLAVLTPDSGRPADAPGAFPAVHDFSELLGARGAAGTAAAE